MIKSTLILIRHGESVYNEKNLFTGWADVELTPKGINQANIASTLIKDYNFSHAFTSNLKRAQNTLQIILSKIGQSHLNVKQNAALNERDYGLLVGQNKLEASNKYGEKQVQIWRRSYSTPPPKGESLKMTAERTIPYFKKNIFPLLQLSNCILVSAHGNSLRSIIMHLHNFSNEQILKTEIGWCEPWVYNFNNGKITNYNILERPNEKSKSYIPNESIVI